MSTTRGKAQKRHGRLWMLGRWSTLATFGGVVACSAPNPEAANSSNEEIGTTPQKLATQGKGSDALYSRNTITVCGVHTDHFSTFASWRNFATEMDAAYAVLTQWQAVSGVSFQYSTYCSSPTWVNGKRYYPEDIRIALVGTPNLLEGTWVAGGDSDCVAATRANECPGYPTTDANDCATLHNRSYAHSPSAAAWDHVCPYNSVLNVYVTADDVYPGCPTCAHDYAWSSGIVLHEMGHALGMTHEFERQDQNNGCSEINISSWAQPITPPDSASIMYYWDSAHPCYSGNMNLSRYDTVGMEVAYPKSSNVPIRAMKGMAFNGRWAAFDSSPIAADWRARGALSSVFRGYYWSKNGQTLLTTLDAFTTAGWTAEQGATVRLTFTDPWGRARSGSVVVIPSKAKAASVVMAAAIVPLG